MVECSGLENRQTGNGLGSSNLPPSARLKRSKNQRGGERLRAFCGDSKLRSIFLWALPTEQTFEKPSKNARYFLSGTKRNIRDSRKNLPSPPQIFTSTPKRRGVVIAYRARNAVYSLCKTVFQGQSKCTTSNAPSPLQSKYQNQTFPSYRFNFDGSVRHFLKKKWKEAFGFGSRGSYTCMPLVYMYAISFFLLSLKTDKINKYLQKVDIFSRSSF